MARIRKKNVNLNELFPVNISEQAAKHAPISQLDHMYDPREFSRSVLTLLESITYSHAVTNQQRNALFRLRYESYLRDGFIAKNNMGVWRDRFDDSGNAFNFGIYVDVTLAASLRMHLLHSGYLESPLFDAYPEEISKLVNMGLRILDLTGLSVDQTTARTNPYMIYAALRLPILMCEHFGVDKIIMAAPREHVPFYRRQFSATQLTEARPWATLKKRLCLLEINYKAEKDDILQRHPFCVSDQKERLALFGPAIWPVKEGYYNRAAQLLGGKDVLKRQLNTTLDAHEVILSGLPGKALVHLSDNVAIIRNPDTFEKALGLSLQTFQRNKKAGPERLLSQEQSGRAWKFAEILGKATELFGSQAEAEAFLERPAIGLDQHRPIDLLSTPAGVELVETHLERIKYGVYA